MLLWHILPVNRAHAVKNSKNSIPEDVYVGYIRSLFQDVGVLPVGAACYGLIALLLYYKTGQEAYLVFGPAMFIAGVWRYFKITRVDHALISDYPSALAWEARYLWWGSLHGFVVGAFGFFATAWSEDNFSELAAVSAILSGTITIAGRNYGSHKMVSILTLTIVFPMALGLMLKGDFYHFVLGLFIAPFMLVVTKMADLVRTVLFTAISEEKRSTRLAQRFDRALNTMHHGLLMLNNEERVVVSNTQAAEMLGFKSSEQMLGRTLKSLLMRGVASGLLSERDYAYAEEQLSRALREGRNRKVLLRMTNGRHFEFAAREGHDEVGVLTFEEVTSRVEAEEKIRFMARYDSLTSLPNRAYFHEKVTEAMAAGDQDRLCGLGVLDLDDFKTVNDTLGHPVGDGLIYAVAERLSAFESPNVRISRFGGDEFMIYFNRVADEGEFSRQFEEIFASLAGEVDVAGHAMRIQASGGAVVVPVRSGDVDSMIVKADLALYRAKELGKNAWSLFETEMDVAFRNRQVMKADLRNAIEARNLRVVYQPIVDAATMRVSSCEALCRWDHPELGLVSPAIFIPLAEEMGLISEISTIVLEAACHECAKWPEHVGVSVNLSAKDFRSDDVIGKVERALDGAGLKPDRLEIEVTETALLNDTEATVRYINTLKKLGVRIALDDFGTGYSSLSYLHSLPLDKIKIDGSFVANLKEGERSLHLLQGVVDLSRKLGLAVTVEGVERFDQLKLLESAVKPDLLQGFLFGPALTASGIETMAEMKQPYAPGQIAAKTRASI